MLRAKHGGGGLKFEVGSGHCARRFSLTTELVEFVQTEPKMIVKTEEQGLLTRRVQC